MRRRHSGSSVSVEQQERMNAHLCSVDVQCDSVERQIDSCVANAKLYQEDEIALLGAVLKGVDITELFGLERVTRFCKKFGLIAGDPFDLRDGYDL